MKNLLMIWFVFIFASCSNNSAVPKQEGKSKNEIIEEEFTSFFQNFTYNSKFRMDRTIIPFKYKMVNENGKIITKSIPKFPIVLDKSKWEEKKVNFFYTS